MLAQENLNVNRFFSEVHNSPKTTLDHALEYLSTGFSIIPIQYGKKEPAIKSWKEYQERQPTIEEIKEWFSSGKKNIALVSGRVSRGHFILEFDDCPRAFAEIVKILPWLSTPTLMTESKRGLHLHLESEFLPNCTTHLTRKYGEGKIEVRGNQTYTLLPPSRHPSGIDYKFINPLTPTLKLNSQQMDELISLFTVTDNAEDDSREAFSQSDVPPITAEDAEEALGQAIALAEPDRSRNIVGYLLAKRLGWLGLAIAEAYPYMILYWKAMHGTGSHKYEKWEVKSSLRSAYKSRNKFQNVGFSIVTQNLLYKKGQPEHNCSEFHNNSEMYISLNRKCGHGQHGHSGKLDCPRCIWELAKAVMLDMDANFRDGLWSMALPLDDKKGMEAVEKKVTRKKDDTGGGVALASFDGKEIGIASNWQADGRMEYIPCNDANNTEKLERFIIKYLSSVESNANGKHKVRPFGSFVRKDKRDKGTGEYYKLRVPAPWKDIQAGLKEMDCHVFEIADRYKFDLSPIGLSFFKGIILNDWTNVKTLPLKSDHPLWKAKVCKKHKKGKKEPTFACDMREYEAENRLKACRANIEATA